MPQPISKISMSFFIKNGLIKSGRTDNLNNLLTTGSSEIRLRLNLLCKINFKRINIFLFLKLKRIKFCFTN